MQKTLKRAAAVLLGAAVLGLAPVLAPEAVAVPQTINYQGLLVQDGVPVDGSKGVRFRIYDAAEGGATLWQEVQTVSFAEGLFSVLLGSVTPIPASVFSGDRRWLSVSIEGGPEIMPRGEIASVGYAFTASKSGEADTARAAGTASTAVQAGNADLLDGLDSSQLSGATHTHDSRYYTQTQVKTSDGTPPNQGSNFVHWNILTGVPEGFADGADNITTNASLITSGTMSPARISGTAVVDSDARLLTVGQKSELTDSGATALHYHLEPFVVHTEADTFKTTSTGLEVVDSVVVDAPRDGFLSITFSGSQLLDVAEICCPMRLAAKRYIALYGVGIDTTDATTYSVTSSMQDTVYYSLGRIHTPAKVVTGNTVRPVSAGQHTIYFLTRITVVIDADVTSKLQSPSLTVVYFPYESGSFAAPGTYPGESR